MRCPEPWLSFFSLGGITRTLQTNHSPRRIMPDITLKHLDEMERYTGEFQKGQQFLFAGKSLGLSTLGMNGLRMPPNWEHYPEHDDAADNEEELYVPLEGSGTLHAEGKTYPMNRGVLIRVGAASRRKIVPDQKA